MLGKMIKGSLIGISIKSENQIYVDLFRTTDNPFASSKDVFCNILSMHAKGVKIFYHTMIPRKHSILMKRGLVFTKRALSPEHLAYMQIN